MIKSKQRVFDPIKATFPNYKKVICRNCLYRDHTTIKIDNAVIPVGVTKSFCKIYREPPETNGKPLNILFNGANCKYFKFEKLISKNR